MTDHFVTVGDDLALPQGVKVLDAHLPTASNAAAVGSKAPQSALDAHTSNVANPHAVTKAQVGLSNVDNTADAAKPVSTAQATALGSKADKVGVVDVEITDPTKGYILKSPNGTRYRLTVGDDGALTTTAL